MISLFAAFPKDNNFYLSVGIVVNSLLILVPVLTARNKKARDILIMAFLYLTLMPSTHGMFIYTMFLARPIFSASINVEAWLQIFLPVLRLAGAVAFLTMGMTMARGEKLPAKEILPAVCGVLLPVLLIAAPGLYSLGSFIAAYLFIEATFAQLRKLPKKVWPVWVFLMITAMFRLYSEYGL